ncbi:MAG TPA: RNA 2',3'-cyclic phosphodiesterase [Geothrix sp.]
MEGRGLRLFFGLPLSADLRDALARWQQTQAATRWSRPDGLHVTLAFLGERPADTLPGLETLASAVAARHRAFALHTATLGGFPRNERTRILWLGLEPSPALNALVQDLRGTLAAAGEAFDPKPFRSHITLARLRQPRALAAFTGPAPAAFAADSFALFESRGQGGHTPLRTWHLREV